MIYNKRKINASERLGGGEGFTWGKGMAEGGRIMSTRTHTDSHFLTKTCLAHSHSPSLFAPQESSFANVKMV